MQESILALHAQTWCLFPEKNTLNPINITETTGYTKEQRFFFI